MKASEFRKCYIGMSELYGAINSDDIFYILKKFYKDLKKTELINDLRKRIDVSSRYFNIWLTKSKNLFIISRKVFNEENMDEIFSQQKNKPFYIPKTIEQLQNPDPLDIVDSFDDSIVDELSRFLKRHFINNKFEDVDKCITIMIYSIVYFNDDSDISGRYGKIIHWLQDAGVCFDEKKTLEKFVNLLNRFINYLPSIYNKGYSPYELAKLSGPININKMKMTLGDGFKERIYSGELDPLKMIEDIKSQDLPISIKESLIEEVKRIMKDKENLS